MSILKDILYKVPMESVVGATTVSIRNIEFDSRKVSLNDVYVAIKGTQVDGHSYIENAVNQGALAIICEVLPEVIINGITYVQVADTQLALAIIASNYYGNPSENLELVGVTGTNGKTTVASLLYQLFKKAGYKVGLLSTVRVQIDDTSYEATHTTPDPIAINKYLAEMNVAGVAYCFMEVSSHGIAQKRTAGLQFAGGIFTNLSHDHLDYHKSFKEYRNVKKEFFDQLPKGAFALVNSDDKNGEFMLQNTAANKVTYALRSYANYRGQILESTLGGLLMKFNDQEVWTKLMGTFNGYNLLAIFATADLLGLETIEILQLISSLESVSGRFQYYISEQKITTIVDYAHTPDALQNVLETINDVRTKNEVLYTIVGCGGDRDTTKRPKMGQIAARLSNKVIITSDNPRFEEPEAIIEAMEAGVEPQDYSKVLTITDRKQAIRTACQMAQTNDIILVAGKGHESYQEIKGERFDFNDYKIIKQTLQKLNK